MAPDDGRRSSACRSIGTVRKPAIRRRAMAPMMSARAPATEPPAGPLPDRHEGRPGRRFSAPWSGPTLPVEELRSRSAPRTAARRRSAEPCWCWKKMRTLTSGDIEPPSPCQLRTAVEAPTPAKPNRMNMRERGQGQVGSPASGWTLRPLYLPRRGPRRDGTASGCRRTTGVNDRRACEVREARFDSQPPLPTARRP